MKNWAASILAKEYPSGFLAPQGQQHEKAAGRDKSREQSGGGPRRTVRLAYLIELLRFCAATVNYCKAKYSKICPEVEHYCSLLAT